MTADQPPFPTENDYLKASKDPSIQFASVQGPVPSLPEDEFDQPFDRPPAAPAAGPQPWPAVDRLGGAGSPPAPPRLAPAPPRGRAKPLLGIAAGLAVGLLTFGPAGFLVGRQHAPAASARVGPAPTAEPSMVAALVANNRAKFSGELRDLAVPWLPDMSGCRNDQDKNGPKLGDGEKQHVLCRDGSLYVHFVTYVSADEKAGDRSYREQLALGTSSILGGSEQPGRKLGGRTGAPGTYVEYATAPAHGSALCGIWWDRDNTDSAVYSDALCDSLGGSWDPLRAVWEQHS